MDGNTFDDAARPAALPLREMPERFQRQANPWILHGYRSISGSAQASFRSWTYIHNESVNIHSHLVAAVAFLLEEWLLWQRVGPRDSGLPGSDFAASSIVLAATICLSLSVTYHTLMNHSPRMAHLCLRLDMLAVAMFIIGDLILEIYVVFWCDSLLRIMYWAIGGTC